MGAQNIHQSVHRTVRLIINRCTEQSDKSSIGAQNSQTNHQSVHRTVRHSSIGAQNSQTNHQSVHRTVRQIINRCTELSDIHQSVHRTVRRIINRCTGQSDKSSIGTQNSQTFINRCAEQSDIYQWVQRTVRQIKLKKTKNKTKQNWNQGSHSGQKSLHIHPIVFSWDVLDDRLRYHCIGGEYTLTKKNNAQGPLIAYIRCDQNFKKKKSESPASKRGHVVGELS
ncbi:hypothetical protein Btru_011607 [Bulinus truncatus]|nr:hypothetical protein Btru_011607 [Bulinus truncatus]